MNDELYKENILDHYRNPRNKHTLDDFDLRGDGRNASCGDTITLFVKFGRDGKVARASFDGDGCAISRASVSMLTDKIVGMNANGLKMLSPGVIYDMLGIRISPGRVKCALLPYEALNDALKNV